MATPRTVRVLQYADLESAYDDPREIAELAGLIHERRGDRETLVVGSGDTTALCALSFCSEAGRGVARPFYRAVAPDADAFGNHEFDHGPAWLADFVDRTPQRWLCANVSGFPGDVPGWDLFPVGGVRVGVVGVAHPETAALSEAGHCSFADPVAAVVEAAGECRRAGAEYVVVCSHAGPRDAAIAREADVDAVLGGHDHDRVTERVDGVPVVRREAGAHLVELELPSGEVEDHPVGGPADGPTGDAPVDDDLFDAYRRRRDRLGLDEELARLDGSLDPVGTAAFVADAYREGAGADVGLVVEASVRTTLGGTVTVGDVVGVAPFESSLVEMRVPGDVLRDAILEGRTPFDDTHGRLVASGATVADGTRVGGDPIDPDAVYAVAATSYLSGMELLGLSADAVVEEHGPQHEALVAYARGGLGG